MSVGFIALGRPAQAAAEAIDSAASHQHDQRQPARDGYTRQRRQTLPNGRAFQLRFEVAF